MKLGVYNAVLHDRPLPDALAVIAGLGLTDGSQDAQSLPQLATANPGRLFTRSKLTVI